MKAVDYFLGAGPLAATRIEHDVGTVEIRMFNGTVVGHGNTAREAAVHLEDADTRPTLEAAEDWAWWLLTRHGGEWRVRHGSRVIARGTGYRPGEPRFTHDRTATWTRVQKERV